MFSGFAPSMRAVSATIAERARELCDRIDVNVHDEDDLTSRLADRIEASVQGIRVGGVLWRVTTRKLPWRGKDSEESRLGADLGLVIRVSGDNFDVRKGYLIQAKLVRDMSLDLRCKSPFTKNDRVSEQCMKMLRLTPESYIWFYSPTGVSVLRAGTVLGVRPESAHRVERRSLYEFFLTGFESWSGDPRLGDIAERDGGLLVREFGLKQTLEVHAVDATASPLD